MAPNDSSRARRRSSELTAGRSSLDETESLILTRTLSQDPNVLDSTPTFDPLENKPSNVDSTVSTATWAESTRYLILLCALITSTSFGVTQVPLVYVFRLMTCDAYYEKHPQQTPSIETETIQSFFMSMLSPASPAKSNDRCAIPAIESSTALSLSILGAGTTIFGLINVFWIGGLIKRIGVKPTLLIQVFFPALRLFIQTVGVEVWGTNGMNIIQASQIVNIIGGPLGYVLALNTFITEVFPYEARTAALGRLNGAMMFGSAFGFLVGGLVADKFGIKAPFRLTFALFLISTIYVAVCLPHIPPAEAEPGISKPKQGWIKTYFGQLLVFAPRKFVLKDGSMSTEYGASLLACAVFLGILATGYLSTLLQLYATNVFEFGTKDNGWLIFIYSSLRGSFLTFAFPAIIATGRKWTMKKEEAARKQSDADAERQPLLADSTTISKQQTFTFDLTYTRFSLIADGFLTLLCSFVHEGRQMYLVAIVLPFAAGTSAAAKGTILQMVGASASSAERTDALAGISLVENMARLSTTFVFGAIFAAFASIGRTELVFTCNAAVALIAFFVLLFARFPPDGSTKCVDAPEVVVESA